MVMVVMVVVLVPEQVVVKVQLKVLVALLNLAGVVLVEMETE
jgi:hypothetical protein